MHGHRSTFPAAGHLGEGLLTGNSTCIRLAADDGRPQQRWAQARSTDTTDLLRAQRTSPARLNRRLGRTSNAVVSSVRVRYKPKPLRSDPERIERL